MILVLSEKDSKHAVDLGLARAGNHDPKGGSDVAFGLPPKLAPTVTQLLNELKIQHHTRPH